MFFCFFVFNTPNTHCSSCMRAGEKVWVWMERQGEIGLGCTEEGEAQRKSQSGSKHGYPDHFSWKQVDRERTRQFYSPAKKSQNEKHLGASGPLSQTGSLAHITYQTNPNSMPQLVTVQQCLPQGIQPVVGVQAVSQWYARKQDLPKVRNREL